MFGACAFGDMQSWWVHAFPDARGEIRAPVAPRPALGMMSAGPAGELLEQFKCAVRPHEFSVPRDPNCLEAAPHRGRPAASPDSPTGGKSRSVADVFLKHRTASTASQ